MGLGSGGEDRRRPPGPGLSPLELGGDADQQILAAELRGQLDPRPAARPSLQCIGSEIAGLAGDVEAGR